MCPLFDGVFTPAQPTLGIIPSLWQQPLQPETDSVQVGGVRSEGSRGRILAFLEEGDGRKCATKCATKHRFLRLLSVLYGSFIVFINQSHGGGFCPSSGLIECEAKPQRALFADFLEGCK